MTARPGRSTTAGVALLIATVFVSMLLGCTSEPGSPATVGDPVEPALWDLSTPEASVRSYLDWVSFSYRMANSDIPTATMTPEEGVRVDAYIQLNRLEGKGIEQSLESLEIASVDSEDASATVVTREQWRYRYFSLGTLEYVSEVLQAEYDVTYSLMQGEGGWIVNRVQATPAGEVQ